MKIFGVDPVKDVNWYLFWYIVFSITFVVVGTQNLLSTGIIAATIYAVGSVMVLIYFGLRWFENRSNKSRRWPPVINMCPDYLTYVPSLPGCIDMLGVTRSSGGLLRVLPSEVNNVKLGNTNKVFEYTSENVRNATTSSAIQAICDRCKSAGVTWEGIYDGDTCTGIQVISDKAAEVAAGKCSTDASIESDFSNLYNKVSNSYNNLGALSINTDGINFV
jgi:hypothetical protein